MSLATPLPPCCACAAGTCGEAVRELSSLELTGPRDSRVGPRRPSWRRRRCRLRTRPRWPWRRPGSDGWRRRRPRTCAPGRRRGCEVAGQRESKQAAVAKKRTRQGSARRAPSRLHRRQRMPEAAPRCGQPRPPTSAALGRFTAGMATLGLGSRRSAAQLLDALGVSHARVAEDAVVHRERARVLGRRGRPRRLRLGNCLFAAVLLRRISLVRVALTGVGSRRRLAPHHVLLVVVAHLRAVGVA